MDPTLHPSKWQLDHVGTLQAKFLVAVFKNNRWKPDFVYSSTEAKTKQSVDPIVKHYKVFHQSLSNFDELHFSQRVEKQSKFLSIRKKQLTNLNYSYMGGETGKEALKRFERGIEKLPSTQNFVICSHGTILAIYLLTMIGIEGDDRFEFWKNMGFGHIWVVEQDTIIDEIKLTPENY